MSHPTFPSLIVYDSYLVSSGKDRALCLYAKSADSSTFEMVACKKSAHKRIVWGCRCVVDEMTNIQCVSYRHYFYILL